MKNIFAIAFLFLCSNCLVSAQNQLRSELNLPRVGDLLMKEQINWHEPGKAGERQTWDVSKHRLIDDYPVDYFSRGDRNIIGAENGMLFFHTVTGDSLMMSGYENPNTIVWYHQPGLIMRFPVAFGATSQSRFAGRGKYHDRWESIVTGEIRTVADATGSLILSKDEILNNVIRVHIRKTEIFRYIPVTSSFSIEKQPDEKLFSNAEPEEIVTDIYQWYEAGYRYPILETVEKYKVNTKNRLIISRDAYFFHPYDQEDYLPDDEANREKRENRDSKDKGTPHEKENNLISFRCYPNPVKDKLNIELEFHEAIAVEAGIWDLYGRLVANFSFRSLSTSYRETFDIGHLLPGYYVVKVFAGNDIAGETIFKTNN